MLVAVLGLWQNGKRKRMLDILTQAFSSTIPWSFVFLIAWQRFKMGAEFTPNGSECRTRRRHFFGLVCFVRSVRVFFMLRTPTRRRSEIRVPPLTTKPYEVHTRPPDHRFAALRSLGIRIGGVRRLQLNLYDVSCTDCRILTCSSPVER